MFHSLRAALAVAALVAIPQFAHAGPIRWGFRAESPDGTILREVRDITDLYYADYFLPDPQYSGEYIPDPTPDNGLHSVIRRSRATVYIFDESTGPAGLFELTHFYVQQYEVRPGGVLDPVYEGYSPGEPSFIDPLRLTLGGNEYAIRSLGGDMTVTVTPGPTAATPEPTTFVLGAMGLGALALGRRVRRK